MRRASHALALVVLVVLAGCSGVVGSGAEWGVEEVSDEVGLEYSARASGVGNGDAGVYVADVNGDGWPDALTIGGDGPALFENTGGEFKRREGFPDVDVSVQGALFFDANGDGLDDLLLLSRRGEAVFLENRGGSFVHADSGLEVDLEVGVGASAADADGDGDLDVFLVQYGDWADGSPEGYLQESGFVENDNGNPNYFFENTDDGFERVDAGIAGERWSLATSFVDLTGDGRPDIHVANDFNNDTLYVNRGGGSFETVHLGAETARNGMSSEVGDFDGDGRPDVFVTNIYFPLSEANVSQERYERLERYFSFVLRSKRIEGNNLLINQGNGTFVDRAEAYGVREGGWGWAAVHTDLDNDMDRDLFHATQTTVRIDEEDPHYTYPMVWTNGADGFASRDASELGFEETNGRGVGALDFDRDGDVDLAVATYNDEFVLYENNAEKLADSNSLQVRVAGGDGTTGIGARVSVSAGNTTQFAVNNARADYQSQDSRVLHFGLGADSAVDVTVVWPDGTEHTFEDVAANQRVVVRPDGTLEAVPGN